MEFSLGLHTKYCSTAGVDVRTVDVHHWHTKKSGLIASTLCAFTAFILQQAFFFFL
jgi:hypothetical protein